MGKHLSLILDMEGTNMQVEPSIQDSGIKENSKAEVSMCGLMDLVIQESGMAM